MTHWQRIEIDAKPADVLEPATPPQHAAIFLHPVGQETLADPVAAPFAKLLVENGFAVVCPFGGISWWADKIDASYDSKMTAERYVLEQVVPWAHSRWPNRSVLGLFGISMGGQGALRIAFKHPAVFPVAVGIAPAIEYHQYYGLGLSIDGMYSSKEACRQDGVPMHLHPSHQPPHVFFCCDPEDTDWHRGCDRLHEKMSALGATHEHDLVTTAGAHTWDYFNAMAPRCVQFMVKGLTQESRRLV